MESGSLDLEAAKEYLAEHKIHVVFEKLAGDLLKVKPTRPVAFMVESLKQYTSQEVIVVVMGIPGSGKSMLLSEGGKRYLDFNNKALAGMNDDEILDQIQQEMSNDPSEPLFIEGFPKTIKQALALEAVLPPELVFEVTCSPSDAEQRLFKRSQFSEENPDTLDSIQRGFAAYQKKCLPLLEYYNARGLVRQIPNTKTPGEAQAVFNTTVADRL
eukprot:TRINITY_DN24565_c0_g1_i1.p1 TRINITY_DN24565_c0_g1~~TRINITY_DN24565_c0_g1_i1.p1  ORF type:complete len:233 (+),score=64.72 TRINITY_DN24565_c0_g1_i1:59-700(+)